MNTANTQATQPASFKSGLAQWMTSQATIAAAKADRKVNQLANMAENDQQRYEEVTRKKLVKEIMDVEAELRTAYPSDADQARITELLAKRYR